MEPRADLFANLENLDTEKFLPYVSFLEKSLSPARFEHSTLTAIFATRLMQREKAAKEQIEKAALAGLLHDMAKEFTDEEYRRLLDKEEPSLYRTLPQPVHHAYAGAIYLEQTFQIRDPGILSAVRYHTTGKAGLSLIGKAVFGADMLSALPPKKAEQKMELPLEQICLDKVTFTIRSLIHKRLPIHSDTTDFYNYLTTYVSH